MTPRERFLSEAKSSIFAPTVFTTGAFIAPKLIDGEMRWIVTGFEDDTFYDGKTIDVEDRAATLEGLINEDEDEDDESDEEDSDLVICLGCSREIPEDEAHNEVKLGTYCENCYNLLAPDEDDENEE